MSLIIYTMKSEDVQIWRGRGWGREAGGARVLLWKFQTYFIHINNSKIINNNKNETDLSPLFREIYFSPSFRSSENKSFLV